MDTTNWIAYLEAARGDDNDARTAARMNLSQSALSRWRAGAQPRPQQVVDFARTYGSNALTGLMAAGYLNRADLSELGSIVTAPTSLSEITTTQLLDELQRRLTELRDTFDTIERTSDRAALEAVVDALDKRHLPASNVTSLAYHRATKHDTPVSSDYITDNDAADLLAEFGYAADERHGADEEAEAPETP